MGPFRSELIELINRYGIEKMADIPDFILADMIIAALETIGPLFKEVLDWHGCDSVCHPAPPPLEMRTADPS